MLVVGTVEAAVEAQAARVGWVATVAAGRAGRLVAVDTPVASASLVAVDMVAVADAAVEAKAAVEVLDSAASAEAEAAVGTVVEAATEVGGRMGMDGNKYCTCMR